MATVVQSIIEPNRDAMATHLDQLFAACREEYPEGLVELRHGSPDNLTGFALFFATETGLKMAADHAVRRNMLGENVYVGVNPRKPGTKRQATAEDVEIAFFQFADIDKADAVTQLVERYEALPPTMTVRTGSHPNPRPHLYWRLEEPVRNMAEWTERQRGIAQALGGDHVIDPPRIMRLAGSVNFPTQKKLTAGYRVELTSLRTEFVNERSEVTPEQVRTTYPAKAEVYAPVEANSAPVVPNGGTTLSAMATGRVRIADLIAAVRSGDQWHNHMCRLTGHLAAIGRTDAEILGLAAGLTLPGYSVDQTAREMMTALHGARTKWALPEPQDDVAGEEADREDGDSVFSLLDLDELEALPPPTWLIDELIADHGLSIVYGDPGAGKSFIVLDMALRIAFGMDWHGVAAKQTGVLYIAGEGARGLGKRVKGWRREHALEGADAPFLLLPIAVQMLDAKDRAKLCRTINAAKDRAGFPIGLTIIDTVSRAIAGQDENGQESMSSFVGACGDIQMHTGGAVIGVHHSGKDKERGMRGSTVLLGGCDASMKVTKSDDGRVTIDVEKQKDAEEAKPIIIDLAKVEWAVGLGKEESTLVPRKAAAAIQIAKHEITKQEATAIFAAIDFAWGQNVPWSNIPQAKRRGRYLPDQMFDDYRIEERDALQIIEGWLRRGYLAIEMRDTRNKVSGLKVVRMLEQD
jgi:hypothetical protein